MAYFFKGFKVKILLKMLLFTSFVVANESGKHIAITGIKDDKSVNWLEN